MKGDFMIYQMHPRYYLSFMHRSALIHIDLTFHYINGKRIPFYRYIILVKLPVCLTLRAPKSILN